MFFETLVTACKTTHNPEDRSMKNRCRENVKKTYITGKVNICSIDRYSTIQQPWGQTGPEPRVFSYVPVAGHLDTPP
jgi:hypothetical protein